MRDKWFGDEKDIIKWTTLLDLADQNDIDSILQVAYYRPDKPKILQDSDLDSDPVQLISGANQDQPDQVIEGVVDFFDDHRDRVREKWREYNKSHSICAIEDLSDKFPVDICVFEKPLTDRSEYRSAVLQEIKTIEDSKIIFLDPDTGIEPSNCKKTHVQKQEIREYYDAIDDGDYLVLYQHARQGESNWEQNIQDQISGLLPGNTEVSRMGLPEISSDVVLYAVGK